MQDASVPDMIRGDIFRADMNSMRMDMNSMQTVTERTVCTLFSVPFTYSPCSLRKKRQNQAHNCPKLRQLEQYQSPLRSSTHLPLRATPSLLPPCVKRDRTIPQTVPNYADCRHNYSAHRRRHVRTNAHAHEYGTIRHAPCPTCYDSTRSRDISHRQRKPNPKTQHITRCRR
mgnify:CR=1 FL=1